MGHSFPQPKLFYQVSLEERVPQDHLLRKIASAVDFRFLYDYVRPTIATPVPLPWTPSSSSRCRCSDIFTG